MSTDATPAGPQPAPVLYAEDEIDDLFFMRTAFARARVGRVLHSVDDGDKAINYLAGTGEYADRDRHPLPALVLLDLNLPLRSGFEVLAWIRSQPAWRELPVIVFSSSGRPEDRRQATELGATDYILKPASGGDFVEVANHLRERWLNDG